MKICIAQIKAINCIDSNIVTHKKWIKIALDNNADLIVFPELSITGYKTVSIAKYALTTTHKTFSIFKELSTAHNISIAVGVPLIEERGITINTVLFQANKEFEIYSKQLLHSDELPYFIPGKKQLIYEVNNNRIAFAICYESLQDKHLKKAKNLGATLYITSVAKPEKGINKAIQYFPKTAKKHAIPILMANAVGATRNFINYGNSSIWNSKGELLKQLDSKSEGIIMFDANTNKSVKYQ